MGNQTCGKRGGYAGYSYSSKWANLFDNSVTQDLEGKRMNNTINPNQQASDENAPNKKKRKNLWSIIKRVISIGYWIFRVLEFFSNEG